LDVAEASRSVAGKWRRFAARQRRRDDEVVRLWRTGEKSKCSPCRRFLKKAVATPQIGRMPAGMMIGVPANREATNGPKRPNLRVSRR
jgi:hypothetical protein